MKKTLLSAIFLFTFLMPPYLVSAQTPTDSELLVVIKSLQAQIVSLVEKIDILAKEVSALKAGATDVPSSSGTSPQNPVDYTPTLAKAAKVELNILSPNGGEITQASTTVAIKWTGKNIPEEGVITGALVDERGGNTYILNEVPNTGFATVILPDIAPGFYRLRLSCGIKGTNFYCSSDGTNTKKTAEDISDGIFIITSAGPILGGGGGNGGGTVSNKSIGGGGSDENIPAVTTIEMLPGNDYYFKGPVTLEQLRIAGFQGTGYPGTRPSELFTFDIDTLPPSTDAAPNTFYFWDPSLRTDGLSLPSGWTAGWLKVGTGPTTYEPSTLPSTYFIIRRGSYKNTPLTFAIPSGVTYFGTTPMNGQPRPWSAPNHAPIATNDSFERPAGLTIKVTEQKILANDSDNDGDTLTISTVESSSARGGTVLSGEGIVLYIPPANFNEEDSFGYTVSDGKGGTAGGKVTITVGPALSTGVPPISSELLPGGSRLLKFSGLPGLTYTIQAATPSGHWDTLGTSVAGENGIYQFEDQSAVSLPNQTYRAIYTN